MLSRFKGFLMRRRALKEDKERMDDILKEYNFTELSLAGQKAVYIIFEASKLVSITTFAILQSKYKKEIARILVSQAPSYLTALETKWNKEMETNIAQTLASQVTNYLTAQSVDEAYQKAKEPLKSIIGSIKDMVPEQAIIALNNNNELRNMIVRNLHFIRHLDWAFKETKPYLSSSQKAQVEYMLNNFGQGVPYDLDHDAFLILAKDFLMKNRSLLE